MQKICEATQYTDIRINCIKYCDSPRVTSIESRVEMQSFIILMITLNKQTTTKFDHETFLVWIVQNSSPDSDTSTCI